MPELRRTPTLWCPSDPAPQPGLRLPPLDPHPQAQRARPPPAPDSCGWYPCCDKWKQSWWVRDEKTEMGNRGHPRALRGLPTWVPSPHNHLFWFFLGFWTVSPSPALSITSSHGTLPLGPQKNTVRSCKFSSMALLLGHPL